MNADQGNGHIEVQGVKCYFPTAPKKYEIINYGLGIKKQKWKRTELPIFQAKDVEIWSGDDYKSDDVISWEEATRQEHIKIYGTDPFDLDRQGNPKSVAGVEIDIDYSMECLESFRAQELDRVYNGVWILIKGKEYYLPGNYYFYLNYWQLKDGYAEFRYTDLELFWFWVSVKKSKNFLGILYITQKGAGKSFISGCINYYEAVTNRKANTTIQSKSDGDAADFFRDKILLPITQLPEFLVPIHKHPGDLTSLNALEFVPRARKGMNMRHYLKMKKDALYSKMQYHNAGEYAAEGGTWTLIIFEEVGKCEHPDNELLLYTGQVKKVKDILESDQLMGPDSGPRNIIEIKHGEDKSYKIIPNKTGWDNWVCSSGHILSMIWSHRDRSPVINGIKYQKDDVVNMTVDSYIMLPETVQNHLMLYKSCVDYEHKNVDLDPYLLGVWLGDGDSARASIRNPDSEIIENIYSHGFKISREKTKDKYMCPRFHILGVNDIMRKYNLLMNKHIPMAYLTNSRENRLQLLAGLLDTDGHSAMRQTKVSCEIIQKSHCLASDIRRLATELGFSCSLNPKQATMKRKDGSIYKCEVYRVSIYGDLHLIPFKVARKKFPMPQQRKRRRNVLKCGFSVSVDIKQSYIGFVIDSDKLYLRSDCQVTHNTDPSVADVYKRTMAMKLSVFRVNKKMGNIFASSTVEDMKEGGAECFKMWKESDQYDLKDTGTTNTGLARFFRSAIDATMFDEYGFSVGYEPEDKETKKYIIETYGEVFGKYAGLGAKAVHDAKRKALAHDQQGLISYIQKAPYNEKEAFWINADKCIYPAQILLDAKDRILSSDRKYTRRGNIVWEIKDVKAAWMDDNKAGRWEVSFFDFEQNMVQMNDGHKKTFTPKAGHKRVMAFDPYSNRDIVREDQGSDAAAVVYNKVDFHVPDEFCDTIVADYLYRHADPFDSYEDIICACFFFGCEVLIEKNKSNALDYFRQRGYYWGYDNNPSDFIMSRPESTFTTYGNKASDGIVSSDPMIGHYTTSTFNHIKNHGHKLKHLRPIESWLIFNPQKTQAFDMAVAASYAIVAAEKRVYEQAKEIDISSIFKTYNNSGGMSKMNKR